MEKWVVFGPIIIFFGFFGLIVFGFFLLVGKLIMQGKNQAWIGEVIDKTHNTKREDNKTEHFLSLKVQLENGEIHNIPATSDFYNQVEIGDKLEKKKGELWPKKI